MAAERQTFTAEREAFELRIAELERENQELAEGQGDQELLQAALEEN